MHWLAAEVCNKVRVPLPWKWKAHVMLTAYFCVTLISGGCSPAPGAPAPGGGGCSEEEIQEAVLEALCAGPAPGRHKRRRIQ